ncbi:unnamed protein product [Closterium sp. Naga37s-1]|nr:unnamed protein product [Closterium sp. Naga37s-1]
MGMQKVIHSYLLALVGVTCDGHHQPVALHLNGLGLAGEIPVEINQIATLTSLDLGRNALSGVIPDSINNILSLQVLNLCSNRLGGRIPELNLVTSLFSLDLSRNQLGDAIPASLGLLTKLKVLELNNNELAGSIPDAVGNLKLLQDVSLAENRLTGRVPRGLDYLRASRTAHYNFSANGAGFCGTGFAGLAACPGDPPYVPRKAPLPKLPPKTPVLPKPKTPVTPTPRLPVVPTPKVAPKPRLPVTPKLPPTNPTVPGHLIRLLHPPSSSAFFHSLPASILPSLHFPLTTPAYPASSHPPFPPFPPLPPAPYPPPADCRPHQANDGLKEPALSVAAGGAWAAKKQKQTNRAGAKPPSSVAASVGSSGARSLAVDVEMGGEMNGCLPSSRDRAVFPAAASPTGGASRSAAVAGPAVAGAAAAAAGAAAVAATARQASRGRSERNERQGGTPPKRSPGPAQQARKPAAWEQPQGQAREPGQSGSFGRQEDGSRDGSERGSVAAGGAAGAASGAASVAYYDSAYLPQSSDKATAYGSASVASVVRSSATTPSPVKALGGWGAPRAQRAAVADPVAAREGEREREGGRERGKESESESESEGMGGSHSVVSSVVSRDRGWDDASKGGSLMGASAAHAHNSSGVTRAAPAAPSAATSPAKPAGSPAAISAAAAAAASRGRVGGQSAAAVSATTAASGASSERDSDTEEIEMEESGAYRGVAAAPAVTSAAAAGKGVLGDSPRRPGAGAPGAGGSGAGVTGAGGAIGAGSSGVRVGVYGPAGRSLRVTDLHAAEGERGEEEEESSVTSESSDSDYPRVQQPMTSTRTAAAGGAAGAAGAAGGAAAVSPAIPRGWAGASAATVAAAAAAISPSRAAPAGAAGAFPGRNSGRGEGLEGGERDGDTSDTSADGDEAAGHGLERYFTVAELALASNDFGRQSERSVLGSGRHGTVYRARLPEGTTVAVKRLSERNLEQSPREFKFEVDSLAQAKHPNLAAVLGCCVEGEERMLVYEYLPNGSLDAWLYQTAAGGSADTLDWPMRMHVAIGCAKGLAHLHGGMAVKVVHRDVKASNVLLDAQWSAKLGDFALAKAMGRDQGHVGTRVMGTFGYVAPEYMNTGLLTERSDVYSFGVLLLELISGRPPIDNEAPSDQECTSRRRGMRNEAPSHQGEPACDQIMMDHEAAPSNRVDLVRWVRAKAVEERLLEVLDPRLQGTVQADDVEYALGVALRCVEPNALKRPKMPQIVHMLESEDPKQRDDWVARRPSPSSARSLAYRDPSPRASFRHCDSSPRTHPPRDSSPHNAIREPSPRAPYFRDPSPRCYPAAASVPGRASGYGSGGGGGGGAAAWSDSSRGTSPRIGGAGSVSQNSAYYGMPGSARAPEPYRASSSSPRQYGMPGSARAAEPYRTSSSPRIGGSPSVNNSHYPSRNAASPTAPDIGAMIASAAMRTSSPRALHFQGSSGSSPRAMSPRGYSPRAFGPPGGMTGGSPGVGMMGMSPRVASPRPSSPRMQNGGDAGSVIASHAMSMSTYRRQGSWSRR